MTIDQFNNTKFSANDRAIYDGIEYCIKEINFTEMLFGLYYPDDEDVFWVRCENITHVP